MDLNSKYNTVSQTEHFTVLIIIRNNHIRIISINMIIAESSDFFLYNR